MAETCTGQTVHVLTKIKKHYEKNHFSKYRGTLCTSINYCCNYQFV